MGDFKENAGQIGDRERKLEPENVSLTTEHATTSYNFVRSSNPVRCIASGRVLSLQDLQITRAHRQEGRQVADQMVELRAAQEWAKYARFNRKDGPFTRKQSHHPGVSYLLSASMTTTLYVRKLRLHDIRFRV